MSHQRGVSPSPEVLPDQAEQHIRRLLHDTLASTPWAEAMFTQAAALQRDFFRYAAHPNTSSADANRGYETVLHTLATMMNVEIRKGHEYMWKLKDAPAVIVASNHLGIGKVGGIDNRDRALDFPGDEIEAFPMGMLPGFFISQLYTGKPQVDIAGEGEGDLGVIHRKLDRILIPRSQSGGGTEALISKINEATGHGDRHVFLTFPEGGTSGKRNNGGPYDLDAFRAGTFVIGSKTGLPILPVCQYFDPQRGLDLFVLPPIQLGEEDLGQVGLVRDTVQQAMQAALSAASER